MKCQCSSDQVVTVLLHQNGDLVRITYMLAQICEQYLRLLHKETYIFRGDLTKHWYSSNYRTTISSKNVNYLKHFLNGSDTP